MKAQDARLFQILFLGSLLAAGVALRDFSVKPAQVVFAFAAGLLTQAAFVRALRLPRVGLLSAVITCFSLSLLVRADNLWVHPLAAVVAMASKFVVRVRGKHIFNPGNLGAILALTLLPGGWVSPGQWGHEAASAGWFFVLGSVVVQRARRADISWTFLALYLGAVALRVLWLGQKWAVWTHQLENGALLLFAFFMISDPMTIPNHRRGRVLYAALVAAIALVWQYAFFWKNGLLWALFLASPTVPLWDRLWPAARFHWTPQGVRHEDERSRTKHREPVVGAAPQAAPQPANVVTLADRRRALDRGALPDSAA